MANDTTSDVDSEQLITSIEGALAQAAELAASEKASAQVANIIPVPQIYILCYNLAIQSFTKCVPTIFFCLFATVPGAFRS